MSDMSDSEPPIRRKKDIRRKRKYDVIKEIRVKNRKYINYKEKEVLPKAHGLQYR